MCVRQCLRMPDPKGPTSLPLLPAPGQGHIQEVILCVAVEGATEAHGVLHPSLVHLQVEPQPFPVIEDSHAHIGPHPQEHGGQPPNLKSICHRMGNRKSAVLLVQPSPLHHLLADSHIYIQPWLHPAENPCLRMSLPSLGEATEKCHIVSPDNNLLSLRTAVSCSNTRRINDPFLHGGLQEARYTIMTD